MKLMTCSLCQKLFSGDGPEICPNCMDRLNSLFHVIRDYIENNPEKDLDAYSLSKALDIDLRYVQALVRLEYLEPMVLPLPEPAEVQELGDETEKKRVLARQLQESLSKSLASQEQKSSRGLKNAMYAQDKYGIKDGGK